MLTPAEMTSMRATSRTALPDACTVTRPVMASDGAGGNDATYGTVWTGACRLDPATSRQPRERALELRPSAVQEWIVTLDWNADVEETDRITIGARTFEVTLPIVRSRQIDVRATCQEVL